MSQRLILELLSLIRHHDATRRKVRIGSLGDGGYVINDDFEGLDGVISLGISTEVSFDHYFAERGDKVYQYDPSVDGPPFAHENFIFRKLAWAAEDGPDSRSLRGMVAENGLTDCHDMLLKFDIEGGEWLAFDSIDSALLSQFRIITGEFHGFCQLDNDYLLQKMLQVFTLLNQTHVAVHLNPNNSNPVHVVHGVPLPNLLEISFLRRDRAGFIKSAASIPSPLDYPNVAGVPQLVLTAFGL